MKIPMTQIGYQKLSNELKELMTVSRPEVIEAISIPVSCGWRQRIKRDRVQRV